MPIRPLLLILILALVTAASGCDEKPPPEESADEVAPASLTVGVTHQRPESLTFSVDGSTIVVETFVVTFGVTELYLCEEASARGFEWIRSAYAHVPSTGTRLGTVFAEDLTTASDAAQIVGDFEPIHGTYCSAVLVAAPADGDVLNSTTTSTEELRGNSLIVAGTIDGEPFRWTTSKPFLARIPLQHLEVGPGSSAQLLFDKRLDETLFIGLTELETDEERAETILQRLIHGVSRWTR